MSRSAISLALLLASILALTACKKGEEDKTSVDANGNCTVQFVEDYNKVISESERLKETLAANPQIEDTIQKAALKAKLACNGFYLTHKTSQCFATKASTYARVRFGAMDLKPNCLPAEEIRAKAIQGKPSTGAKFDGTERTDLIDVIDGV